MHFSFRGQRPVERSEVALDLKHQSPKKNCKELTGQHTSRLLPIQKCACKSHHSRLPRAAFAKGTYARAAKSHYSRTSERFARKSNYSRTYAKTGGGGATCKMRCPATLLFSSTTLTTQLSIIVGAPTFSFLHVTHRLHVQPNTRRTERSLDYATRRARLRRERKNRVAPLGMTVRRPGQPLGDWW